MADVTRRALTGAPIPRSLRHAVEATRRWTHPVTLPAWAAVIAAATAAVNAPVWVPVVAAIIMWGEGRIWPDSRRVGVSVVVGAVCVGAVIPPPLSAGILAAVLAAVEAVVEHTERGRAFRRRRAIRDAWPAVAESIGAKDTVVLDVNSAQWRDRITFRVPDGQVTPPLSRVALSVASALRRPAQTVRALAGREEGSVIVEVRNGEPLAEPVPHPLPTRAARGWRVPFAMGDNGRRVLFDLTKHALVAGMTGAGKSTAIQSILLSARPLLETGRLRLAIIDRKGGVELGGWAGFADLVDLGDNGDAGSERVLRAVQGLIDERLIAMREAGRQSWDHAIGPQLLLIVDEAATLGTTAREVMRDIAMRGRAPGVTLLIGVQHPTKDNVDRTVLLQLDQRVAMRVRDASASRHVADGNDPDLTDLPLGGHFWLLGGVKPRRGRVFRVDERDVPVWGPDMGEPPYINDASPGVSEPPPSESFAVAEPGFAVAKALPMGPVVQTGDVQARPRPDTSGLPRSAAAIVEACGWVAEPIAVVRERAGVSQASWSRHAADLESTGIIVRDGRTVRLSQPADSLVVNIPREIFRRVVDKSE